MHRKFGCASKLPALCGVIEPLFVMFYFSVFLACSLRWFVELFYGSLHRSRATRLRDRIIEAFALCQAGAVCPVARLHVRLSLRPYCDQFEPLDAIRSTGNDNVFA